MDDWNIVLQQQKNVCGKEGVSCAPIEPNSLIGINVSLFTNTMPINGLRHPKHGNIEGWHLWSGGEIPQLDTGYFEPLHVKHLYERQRLVLKYLGLPTGWRFQVDNNGYEDIWFDPTILNI